MRVGFPAAALAFGGPFAAQRPRRLRKTALSSTIARFLPLTRKRRVVRQWPAWQLAGQVGYYKRQGGAVRRFNSIPVGEHDQGAIQNNMSIRPVKRLVRAKPTLEGAGVHLRRAFGFGNTSDFDPFLLLDDFRNDIPADYAAGFPWHPHRGIETITYVLAGTVQHGDSMGNRGAIAAGDIQWMTAGR